RDALEAAGVAIRPVPDAPDADAPASAPEHRALPPRDRRAL
ncbi:LamB/YcsF family protein, partial [Clavibacter lycopersici]